jgi:hypothetical protein
LASTVAPAASKRVSDPGPLNGGSNGPEGMFEHEQAAVRVVANQDVDRRPQVHQDGDVRSGARIDLLNRRRTGRKREPTKQRDEQLPLELANPDLELIGEPEAQGWVRLSPEGGGLRASGLLAQLRTRTSGWMISSAARMYELRRLRSLTCIRCGLLTATDWRM